MDKKRGEVNKGKSNSFQTKKPKLQRTPSKNSNGENSAHDPDAKLQIKKENEAVGSSEKFRPGENEQATLDQPKATQSDTRNGDTDGDSSDVISQHQNREDSASNKQQLTWSTNAMAMSLPKSTLDLDAEDLHKQFRLLKFEHENKMTLNNIPAANKAARATAFKLDLPLEARRTIMNMDWTKLEKDSDCIQDIIDVVCEAKKKKSSKIRAKNKFHNRQMQKKERSAEYKQMLLTLVEQRGYPAEIKEMMVRDQIIRGHHDENMRRQMLMLEDTDVDASLGYLRAVRGHARGGQRDRQVIDASHEHGQ